MFTVGGKHSYYTAAIAGLRLCADSADPQNLARIEPPPVGCQNRLRS